MTGPDDATAGRPSGAADDASSEPSAADERRGRYRLDASTRLVPGTPLLIGGSPLRLMRLTARGRDRVSAVAAGEPISRSALIDRLVDAGAIHPVVRPDSDRVTATTVVIPTRDGDPDRLVALVAACQGVARVIVVDDGSSPPVEPVAGADVVRHGANGGPAVARNTGWRAAATEYVAFVDDDVVIDDPSAARGWLAALLGLFDDPAVGAVAPRIRSIPGDGRLGRYERDESPLDLGPEPALVAQGARVSYVPAASVVFRRSALETIGGFDEALRFGEDVDAIWRLTERGRRCRYEPDVCVLHVPRSSWREWAVQRYSYGSSAAPLAQRHPGALAPIHTTGWSVVVWALVAARRPIAAVGLAAGTAMALVRRVPDLGLRESSRLTALGHIHAGRMATAAVRRVWWPFVAVGALRSRTLRRVLLLSITAALVDRPSGRTPVRALIRLVDDVSYSVGVWAGVVRHRETGPLRPRLISWPGGGDGSSPRSRWETTRRWLRSAT